jgi:hypothetical protein
MAFNINDMKSSLKGGGARPNLFDVQISFPGSIRSLVSQQNDVTFKVEAAQIPQSTVGLIQVPYFGRFMKYAGDRTFQPWQVNVINDEDFKLRHALESWSNSINEMIGNKRKLNAADYKQTAYVQQYSKTGRVIRTYKFDGIFPVSVGEINLEWSPNDQIERFAVVFEFDYWTVVDGNTGTLRGATVGSADSN